MLYVVMGGRCGVSDRVGVSDNVLREGGSTIRWTQIPTILVSDNSATLVAEW